MPPPREKHQQVSALQIQLILPVITQLGGRWYHAPTGVFFPGADPVQPDLLVLLPANPTLISERGIEGAPGLVVEILSPGNARHDLVTKRKLYAQTGVREGWIVSPETESIEVLALEGDTYRTHLMARSEQRVSSTVLPGLDFAASEIFS